MKRADFFSLLPRMDAQFGNLILIRDKADRKDVPGIQQCFLSSVIQFQPLARLALRGPDGGTLPLALASASSDPILSRKTFEGGGFRLSQELVVSADEASLLVRVERLDGAEGAAAPRGGAAAPSALTLLMDGACLFSPQGVPYHWRDESLVALRRAEGCEGGEGRVEGEWTFGKLPFDLASSLPFAKCALRTIPDEGILRTHYFTSFNLKKRYTYWVEEPASNSVGEAADHGFEKSAAHEAGEPATGVPVASRNVGYKVAIGLGELGAACEIVFAFAVGKGAGAVVASAGRHAELVRREIAEWDDFLAGIPEFSAADVALERMYYTSWFVLKSNRVRFDDPRFPYPFTSVNKHHYYNQFFWDSAYQAIAWLWYNKAEPARDELRNFAVNQWRNGMIPYELFMYPVNGREWMDGDGTSTGMTQPPVIGIALPEIYRKFGGADYLDFFYDSLLRYEEWLTLYRDLGKRGLSCYLNIWETGCDNSPRLDASARNRVLDPAIESADFNAYIYYMRSSILDAAKILGRVAPPRIAERMAATKRSMNTLMYDPEDGFYHDIVAGTEERIPVKTAGGLIPLITDIPDGKRRARIVADYVDSEKEFMSGCPVPSVSRSEESYNPIDFWRGANWPQITWTVVFSLADTDPETAGEILGRFLDTTKTNVTCYEYYDAETGEGVGMPFQGWGALYTDMIMRFVAGIVPENAGMRFRPLPMDSGDFAVSNVALKDLKLGVSREGRAWTFDFCGYGSFTLKAAHSFRAAPAKDGSSLHVEFGPGCDSTAIVPGAGDSRIEFFFAPTPAGS